jgi:hypothetical protein
MRDLATDEDRSRIQRPNIVDAVAFHLVIGKVTHKAILLVANDWEGLKSTYNTNRRICQPSELCDYELPLRYGLPCAHRLAPYLISDAPIPLTLFHPRWHLGGRPVLRTDLVKVIPADPTPHDYLDSSETTTAMHEVLQLRHQLTGDGKSRLDEMLIKQAEVAKKPHLRF